MSARHATGSAQPPGEVRRGRIARHRNVRRDFGVVVLSCTALIAPVVWGALVDSPAPRWSEQSCGQGTGAAGAARCPDNARIQAFRPPQRVQLAPLIPHL
jgi:hypothetical protein